MIELGFCIIVNMWLQVKSPVIDYAKRCNQCGKNNIFKLFLSGLVDQNTEKSIKDIIDELCNLNFRNERYTPYQTNCLSF